MPRTETSPELTQATGDLMDLAVEIDAKVRIAREARTAYQMKKAEWRHTMDKGITLKKLTDPEMTQTDLAAYGRELAYDAHIAMIQAEATWRAAQDAVLFLRDKQDALKEASYNARQELKRFPG